MTLLLGASCLALAVASAAVFGRPATPAADRAVAKPAPTTVVPAQPTPASSAEKEGAASVPSVSIDELPTTSDRPANEPKKASLPSATNSKPAASPASKPGADSEASEALERETLLVTGARRALNAGDADKALALLDEHARLFPNGWLANDRAAERIVVLCSLGRQAEATREAAAFLRGRPKSPLTRRVETSCAVQTPKTRQ